MESNFQGFLKKLHSLEIVFTSPISKHWNQISKDSQEITVSWNRIFKLNFKTLELNFHKKSLGLGIKFSSPIIKPWNRIFKDSQKIAESWHRNFNFQGYSKKINSLEIEFSSPLSNLGMEFPRILKKKSLSLKNRILKPKFKLGIEFPRI